MRMVFGISVGVILLFVVSLFTFWLIDDFIIALTITMVIASLPYFTLIFPALTFYVPGDKAWIMVNPWQTEETVKKTAFSGFRKIKAQREYQSGYHWRWPKEELVVSVDLSRKILVVPEAGEVITTKDGKTYRIDWFVPVTPLPGSLINYTKTNEDDIKRQVKGKVKQFIQGFLGQLESLNIEFGNEQLELFKIKFEKQFGGEEKVDDLEENLGIWTGTPRVLSVRQSSIAEEAKQLVQAIGSYKDVANDLVTSSNGSLTFREALGLVTMLQQNLHGGQQLSFVDATDLLLGKTSARRS